MNARADLHPETDTDDADAPRLTVFVDRYRTEASIGVWDHERQSPQPLCFSLKVDVEDANGRTPDGTEDQHSHVVCYQDIVEMIEAHLTTGHVDLVETLAYRLLSSLQGDQRINGIWLRVEKNTAIRAADSVGVELRWTRKK